jgi:hypothetical protein
VQGLEEVYQVRRQKSKKRKTLNALE